MQIELSKIAFDEGTQARAKLDDATVAAYAELMTDGGTLPPVTVFFDGSTYWLADGYHRVFAHRKIGALKIEAEVRPGGRRDAVLHAVGANATHGLPRTNEDKRRAVSMLLADEEWSQWSDREIARRCHVGHTMVAALRRPEAAERQEKARTKSAAKKVESDSTPARSVESGSTRGQVESDSTRGQVESDSTPATPRDRSHEEPGAAEEMSRLRELLAEQTAMLEEAQAEIESLSKIVDANDQMAEALRQIKQLQSEVRSLRDRQNGLMGELAEAKRIAKALRVKIDRIEKGRA